MIGGQDELLQAFSGKINLMKRLLSEGQALRIGESSLCSMRIHTLDGRSPDTATVLYKEDAGRVLYNRKEENRILHLDVFHKTGRISPAAVRAGIIRGIHKYMGFLSSEKNKEFEQFSLYDYIDIQTGLGGGRLSGSLTGGREKSIRKVHQSHVHLAMIYLPDHLTLLYYLVDGIEEALQDRGLEIRRLKGINYEASQMCKNSKSPFATPDFDSLLGSSPNDGRRESNELVKISRAMEMVEIVGDLEETLWLVEMLKGEKRNRKNSISKRLGFEWERVISEMRKKGFCNLEKLALTEMGKEIGNFLLETPETVRRELRKSLYFSACKDLVAGKGSQAIMEKRKKPGKKAKTLDGANWLNNIAVAETVTRGFARRTVEGFFHLHREDFFVYDENHPKKMDVCLLIDFSSSMAGKKLGAAKEFVLQMMERERNRWSILIFREKEVKVLCRFTRDREEVRQALSSTAAFGLTPLAHALEKAAEYLMESPKKQILLLLTDGVPTISLHSKDPLQDALNSALTVKEAGVKSVIMGLEGDKDFLEKLSLTMGSCLYLLKEISTQSLLEVSNRIGMKGFYK